MGTFVKVAEQDEIAGNTGKLIEVRGRQIALLREGDTYSLLSGYKSNRINWLEIEGCGSLESMS